MAQLAVDVKSNEITAISELIGELDLEGHTVSLDAMGCQKAIARQLYLAKADYLLALKGNQSSLYKRVEGLFSDGVYLKFQKERGKTVSISDISNTGHGRWERRVVLATDAIDWIDKQESERWFGLTSVICVEAHREEISTGKKSIQKRYYLSSRQPDAEELQRLIRGHWRIENQCHWILDVVCNEDRSRISKGNAAENIALLRKIAFNLLKADTTVKDTVRGKKVRAMIDNHTLETFLRLRPPK